MGVEGAAVTLRASLMRLIRGNSSDEPVRLRFDAPTVTREETAKLGPRWIEDQPDTWVEPIDLGEDLPV